MATSDLTPTVEVLYSCRRCGLKKIAVAVPARTDEDVVAWVQSTGALLGADHARRRPHCRINSLDEVMIPVSGTDRIGGAPVQ